MNCLDCGKHLFDWPEQMAGGGNHMLHGTWAVQGHHQRRGSVDAELAQYLWSARVAVEYAGAGGAIVCYKVCLDVEPDMGYFLTDEHRAQHLADATIAHDDHMAG